MEKVNILIPFHLPKIKYLKKLILSYQNNINYIDLYLIFTNQREYQITKKNINLKNINILVLPKNINHYALESKNIYPTFKKFYALQQTLHKNQFSICIDSECVFLNLDNIYEICNNFCNKKEIYGAPKLENLKINQASFYFLKNFMDIPNNNIDLEIYHWFSEIPIYNNEITNKFLKKMNFINYNNFINKLTWEAFDYNIYVYYCYLFEDYRIINLNNLGINLNWSLECNTNCEVFNKLKEKGINIFWRFWKFPKLEYNIKILYHLDR
jgi:hypothetical protein